MSGLMSSGVAPAPGDEALITEVSVYRFTGRRWLRVERVQPCRDPALRTGSWAWLSGRWTDDDTPARVMVWLDRLLVRKAAGAAPCRAVPVRDTAAERGG